MSTQAGPHFQPEGADLECCGTRLVAKSSIWLMIGHCSMSSTISLTPPIAGMNQDGRNKVAGSSWRILSIT